jgi:hypothetical protein
LANQEEFGRSVSSPTKNNKNLVFKLFRQRLLKAYKYFCRIKNILAGRYRCRRQSGPLCCEIIRIWYSNDLSSGYKSFYKTFKNIIVESRRIRPVGVAAVPLVRQKISIWYLNDLSSGYKSFYKTFKNIIVESRRIRPVGVAAVPLVRQKISIWYSND